MANGSVTVGSGWPDCASGLVFGEGSGEDLRLRSPSAFVRAVRSDSSRRTRVEASSACSLSMACRMSSISLFFHEISAFACSKPMVSAATCGMAPPAEGGTAVEVELDSSIGGA